MPNDNGTGNHNIDPDGHHTNRDTGYSAEYVRSLRDEAATWRTKLRETEAKLTTLEETVKEQIRNSTVSAELAKRNLKIDPSWIKLEDKQEVKDAVDKFLKDYPQFGTTETNDNNIQTKPKPVGKTPMAPNLPNSNIENTDVSELGAIKADPVARAKLRQLYRGLLAQSARSSNSI